MSYSDRVQALSEDAALEAFLRQYIEEPEPRPSTYLSHLRPRRRPTAAVSVTYLRDLRAKPKNERRPDHGRP